MLHLFLVEDDAQRFLEDLSQFGQVVGHALPAVFSLDEVIDHSASQRSGAVEGVESGEIFQLFRLEAPQDVLHAAAFKLKNAVGQTLGEHLIGSAIVHRQGFQADFFPGGLANELDGVVEDGQGRQRQKIHLEQPDLLQMVHGVLGGDFVLAALVEWHDLREGYRGDHHTGGVSGGVPRHSLQSLGDVKEVAHPLVFGNHGAQVR